MRITCAREFRRHVMQPLLPFSSSFHIQLAVDVPKIPALSTSNAPRRSKHHQGLLVEFHLKKSRLTRIINQSSSFRNLRGRCERSWGVREVQKHMRIGNKVQLPSNLPLLRISGYLRLLRSTAPSLRGQNGWLVSLCLRSTNGKLGITHVMIWN